MSKKDQVLIQKAKEIHTLYLELNRNGYRNKDLAKVLNIYPSAFSVLFNKIIKALTSLSEYDTDVSKKVQQLFSSFNNVSEVKTRQRISDYIEKLKEVKIQSSGTSGEKLKRFIENLIDDSPREVMARLEGIYHCYYLSSFGYKIKREPLMISYSPINESYLIRKGNDMGPAKYLGFGYLSNNHIFTIQIKELDTLVPDNYLAHFHLPPSYSVTMNLMKGISVSMSNAYLPISRKVILHKYSNETRMEVFNKQETFFFKDESMVDNSIVQYLQKSADYIEYLPIPQPSYDVDDLAKEERLKMVKLGEG